MSKATTFGQRLKQAREQAGMTQAELARAVGYKDRNAVWQWERDKQTPPLTTVPMLAEALEVDACWLAFGTVQSASPQALPAVSPAARKANSPSRKHGDR